jgi:hypothetical protein
MSTGPLLVGDRGPGDRDDGHEAVQSPEVVGVGRVQREPFGDRAGGDHEVHGTAARLAPGCDDGGGDAPVDARGLGVEGDRVELALGALQDLQAAGALGVLVVHVLLVVGADLVRAGGQLGEGDGADRHLLGQLGRVDPGAQDQDVGVEQALPRGLTAHTGSPPPGPARPPDRLGTPPG